MLNPETTPESQTASETPALDTVPLTPEESLELDRLRAESARLRTETAEFEAKAIKLRAENEQLLNLRKQTDAVAEGFKDSGVKFHDIDAVKVLLAEGGHAITIGDDGKATVAYDGEQLSLAEGLRRFAEDNKFLADGRTIRETTRPKSKESFKTREEKMEFINKHGVDAFEALPLRAPHAGPVKCFDDFVKLTLSEKSRLLREDPDFLRRLPRYPPEVMQQRRTGIRVNKTGRGTQTL